MGKRQAFYLIIIVCFACCRKDTPANLLPPLTTTGNMTFACIINGNTSFVTFGNYVAPGEGVIGWNSGGGVAANLGRVSYVMWACNGPTKTYQFYFYIADSIKAGTYNLGKGTANNMMVTYTGAYGNSQDTAINYQTNQDYGAQLNFVRASDSIYSGTFSGTLTNGNEEFSVSEGRFDVRVY